MKPVAAAGACLVLAALGTLSAAQIGYLWSFDELTAQADLIVIAEPVATDEGRRANHRELKPALPVIELATTFTVLSVLKADASAANLKTFRLLHYRIDWDEWQRQNPAKLGQPPPGVVNVGSKLDFRHRDRSYLLFLRRLADGRYEPLSGHTFPTDSVYVLRKFSAREEQGG